MFSAKTHSRSDFAFGSLGGLFVLLAFLPSEAKARANAISFVQARLALFDDHARTVFCVVREEAEFAARQPQLPGLRYFHDPDGAIAERFGLLDGDGGTQGQWVLLDPSMRIVVSAPLEQAERVFATVEAFNDPDLHAGVPLHAPVLIVPRVFEPAFCKELIAAYQRDGGSVSGVMRDIGGKTVGVIDNFKKRCDATIGDEALKIQIQSRIHARLLPEIAKAFMFKVTRMERYIVARYDAEEGGYFRPHRDNTTKATAHRQFACSINLNSEDFEGGDLRFPEFGRRTYRPPTGGAVIFSCALLHEATPVTRGTRYAFLPFFYNDEAARIRRENEQFLVRSASKAEPESA